MAPLYDFLDILYIRCEMGKVFAPFLFFFGKFVTGFVRNSDVSKKLAKNMNKYAIWA